MDARNTGHGHVRPRPDGVRARCGGPGVCQECSKERAALDAVLKAQSVEENIRFHVELTGRLPEDWDKILAPDDVSIQRIWEVHRRLFGIEKTSPLQQTEMRRTFVLGFSECFKILTDYCGNCSEQEAEKLLSRIAEEIDRETDKIKQQYRRGQS